MAILNNVQAIVAFKQLLGKSNTDIAKEVGNEAEGIFFNIPAQAVWMDDIDPTPSVAVAAGKAVSVVANMIVDGTSNGHALFAVWPTLPPTGTDPLTSNPFSYGTGSLQGILAGDRVRNAISSTYGSGYEAKPYAGVNLISPGDPRDWIYQYNSGIFFQQDGSADLPAFGGSAYTNPTTINVYVYIGVTLDNFSGGGGGGSSEFYNSVLSIDVIPPVSPSVGDRYLIGNGSPSPSGAWVSHDDQIAEWTGTFWKYTVPTAGGTVLVDDTSGFIFIYTGSYPSGHWNKVPFSTTRAGIANGINTYTMTVAPPVLAYDTNLVILATFNNANTGASTLNVNGVGAVSLLKPDGIGGLTNLSPNEIKPGLIYMIVYDGFTFQIFTGETNFLPLMGTLIGHPLAGDVEVLPGTKIYTTGSPSNPAVKFEMSNILIEGGVAKYDQDRTSEFDNLTLVHKGYVDSVTGGTPDSNIDVVANYAGTSGSPAMDSYNGNSGSPGIQSYEQGIIYLVTFDTINTGAAELNIDGQGYLELLKGDELLGLVSLSAGDIQTTIVYYVVFDGTQLQLFTVSPAQLPGTYTNLNPTTAAVGGVPVGTTFSNTTYSQVFDMLFYPYVPSVFTSFSISGQSTNIEVGASVSAGSKTFLWNTTVPANVMPNSIDIKNLTGGITLATGLANDGTETITVSAVTNTTQTSNTWRIYGTRTNNTTFTADYSVNWLYRVFSGTSTNTTLTEPQIEALTNNGLQSAFGSTVNFAAGGYKYYCIPSSFGYPAQFKDTGTNLAVAMAGVAEGYTSTNGNGMYYMTVSVTNAFSVTVNYRVYRTKNLLGGSISILII